MVAYTYILRIYDSAEPWVLLATTRESIEPDDDQDFNAWAQEAYPSTTHGVELEREPFRWASHG